MTNIFFNYYTEVSLKIVLNAMIYCCLQIEYIHPTIKVASTPNTDTDQQSYDIPI